MLESFLIYYCSCLAHRAVITFSYYEVMCLWDLKHWHMSHGTVQVELLLSSLCIVLKKLRLSGFGDVVLPALLWRRDGLSMQRIPTTTRHKCGPIRGLGWDDLCQQEDGEWNSVGISTLQHRQTHMFPPAPFCHTLILPQNNIRSEFFCC